MEQRATIVTDLGFGDAGKGTTVDYLARQMEGAVVVRYNGGAQAAHNVHTATGRHHTFSQFGSGTFVLGVRTFLSRFMLVDPFALKEEARRLEQLGVTEPFARIAIDGDAIVVTPFQKAGNRLREMLRGHGRHGSCGMGIGETMSDSIAHPELTIRVADLRSRSTLLVRLKTLQELKYVEFSPYFNELRSYGYLGEELQHLYDYRAPELIASALYEIGKRLTIASVRTLKRLAETKPLIFEGAQGVLLDERHGFHPYTTWSTTTAKNANTLLADIGYDKPVSRYGVVRAYSTRHGAGPFPTEDMSLTTQLPDEHNRYSTWQEGFRVGWFDVPLTRYALMASEGVDSLVVTHLDRLDTVPSPMLATRYRVPAGALTNTEVAALIIEPRSRSDVDYVTALRPKFDAENKPHQLLLGEVLRKAEASYTPVSERGEAYADRLGGLLGLPVVLTSYGKTAAEKCARGTSCALAA